MLLTTEKNQLYKCKCGKLTDDTICNICGSYTEIVWNVYEGVHCCGAITANSYREAIIKLEKAFKNTDKLQLRFRFATPEEGMTP